MCFSANLGIKLFLLLRLNTLSICSDHTDGFSSRMKEKLKASPWSSGTYVSCPYLTNFISSYSHPWPLYPRHTKLFSAPPKRQACSYRSAFALAVPFAWTGHPPDPDLCMTDSFLSFRTQFKSHLCREAFPGHPKSKRATLSLLFSIFEFST